MKFQGFLAFGSQLCDSLFVSTYFYDEFHQECFVFQ